MLGSNRVGIANLGNVEYLPNRGATIIALPLRLDGARFEKFAKLP